MAQRRPREHITITIVPHDGQRTHTIRVSRPVYDALKGLAGALVVATLLFASSFFDARDMAGKLRAHLDLQLRQYARLERAYLESETRYEGLLSQALTIQKDLASLATSTRELRQMLLNADAVPPPPLPPVRQVAAEDAQVGRGGPAGHREVIQVVTATLKYADDQLAAFDDHVRSLRSTTLEYVRRRAHTPSIWPADGYISSTFGPRRHPVTGEPDYHYAVDVAGMTGTPVLAAADGTVVMAGRKGGYGLTIMVDHGYGLRTLYGHLSRILVRVGQRVAKGQQIGAMGSTGLSTGPHLHYEVHLNGRPVNPFHYLP